MLSSTMYLVTVQLLLFALGLANPIPAIDPQYEISPTNANGTANPFFPCGATADEVAACPYRCYTKSGTLRSQCFDKQSATAAINSLQNICVQCVVPDQPEDYAGGCQPLNTYFNTTDKFASRPSYCGFKHHRLRECAWECGEARVPFTVCSATNTTGMYSLCERCLPQCSSPRIVFQPRYLPSNFSLSAGSCSTQYGPQETVACPYRCTTGGDPNTFCSLNDKTDSGPDSYGFTTCTACK